MIKKKAELRTPPRQKRVTNVQETTAKKTPRNLAKSQKTSEEKKTKRIRDELSAESDSGIKSPPQKKKINSQNKKVSTNQEKKATNKRILEELSADSDTSSGIKSPPPPKKKSKYSKLFSDTSESDSGSPQRKLTPSMASLDKMSAHEMIRMNYLRPVNPSLVVSKDQKTMAKLDSDRKEVEEKQKRYKEQLEQMKGASKSAQRRSSLREESEAKKKLFEFEQKRRKELEEKRKSLEKMKKLREEAQKKEIKKSKSLDIPKTLRQNSAENIKTVYPNLPQSKVMTKQQSIFDIDKEVHNTITEDLNLSRSSSSVDALDDTIPEDNEVFKSPIKKVANDNVKDAMDTVRDEKPSEKDIPGRKTSFEVNVESSIDALDETVQEEPDEAATQDAVKDVTDANDVQGIVPLEDKSENDSEKQKKKIVNETGSDKAIEGRHVDRNSVENAFEGKNQSFLEEMYLEYLEAHKLKTSVLEKRKEMLQMTPEKDKIIALVKTQLTR